MDIVNLPNDLLIEGGPFFKVYDYQTSDECFRQMVSLQQNTFSFLMEGRKEVFSNKTSIAIDKSKFILIKMGHCLMTERLPNSLDSYRSILFFFSNESVASFIQKHKIKDSKKSSQESIYSFVYDDFVKNFVIGLMNISKLNSNVRAKLLEVKFEELMIYLIEVNGADFIYSLISNAEMHVQHFVDIIEKNKLNKLSVKELSFIANMSVSTFKREFEKYFHSSPSKWFQNQRLEHAAFLLKNKSKRPSDMFEEIGYESLSNFIQAFKGKYGVSPKQYQLD